MQREHAGVPHPQVVGTARFFFPQSTTLSAHVLLLTHPVVEQAWETFEPFLDTSICIIPFLTGVQVLSGGIPPE